MHIPAIDTGFCYFKELSKILDMSIVDAPPPEKYNVHRHVENHIDDELQFKLEP